MNAHIGGINSENLSFLFHLLLTNGKYIKCISILLGVVSSLPLSISFGVVRNILWLPTLVLRLNIVLLLTLPQNFFTYTLALTKFHSLSHLCYFYLLWQYECQIDRNDILSDITSSKAASNFILFPLMISLMTSSPSHTLEVIFMIFFLDSSALLGPPYYCISYLGNNLCTTTINITLMYCICCTVCTTSVRSM